MGSTEHNVLMSPRYPKLKEGVRINFCPTKRHYIKYFLDLPELIGPPPVCTREYINK